MAVSFRHPIAFGARFECVTPSMVGAQFRVGDAKFSHPIAQTPPRAISLILDRFRRVRLAAASRVVEEGTAADFFYKSQKTLCDEVFMEGDRTCLAGFHLARRGR